METIGINKPRSDDWEAKEPDEPSNTAVEEMAKGIKKEMMKSTYDCYQAYSYESWGALTSDCDEFVLQLAQHHKNKDKDAFCKMMWDAADRYYDEMSKMQAEAELLGR